MNNNNNNNSKWFTTNVACVKSKKLLVFKVDFLFFYKYLFFLYSKNSQNILHAYTPKGQVNKNGFYFTSNVYRKLRKNTTYFMHAPFLLLGYNYTIMYIYIEKKLHLFCIDPKHAILNY